MESIVIIYVARKYFFIFALMPERLFTTDFKHRISHLIPGHVSNLSLTRHWICASISLMITNTALIGSLKLSDL